jgi:hypothetical protein
MAKMKTNTGGDKDKPAVKYKPKDAKYKVTDIYTTEQQNQMGRSFGGDTRAKAAAIKEDIHGGNMPKRYPVGSEGYKEAVRTSTENATAKMRANRTATSAPANTAGTMNAIKETAPNKTGAAKYAASDDARRKYEEEAKKKDAKGKVIWKGR